LTADLKIEDTRVDVFKLSVAVRVVRRFYGLSVALPTKL
jgi:hypothetical protein